MRYFLEIAYDGSNYCGWQIQHNAISVQQVLNKMLTALLREPINTIGAGRTDTGVHAKQLYVHLDINQTIDFTQFLDSINKMLPADISVNALYKIHNDAHARFDATSRTYHYFIHQQKNPFLINKSVFIKHKLNVPLMNEAAQLLLKYTDFTSFSKLHTDTKTNLCTVSQAVWTMENNQLKFAITANRFLRNMVRAIVGTLIDVGKEKITVDDFEQIIIKEIRSAACESAPAKGLYLVSVTYPYALTNE